jgi:hypothetical protein
LPSRIVRPVTSTAPMTRRAASGFLLDQIEFRIRCLSGNSQGCGQSRHVFGDPAQEVVDKDQEAGGREVESCSVDRRFSNWASSTVKAALLSAR